MSHSLFSFVQGLLLQWLPVPDHFLVVALILAGVTAAIATLLNGHNPVFSDNNWATPLWNNREEFLIFPLLLAERESRCDFWLPLALMSERSA